MDSKIEKLVNDAVKVGMEKVPAGVPDYIKELASGAILVGINYLVEQLEPKSVKIKMKKGAKATARIE